MSLLFAMALASAPLTKTVDVVDTYHGCEVADPYQWLEGNDVREWVAKETAYTKAMLDKIPYRGAMGKRLQELFDYSYELAPIKAGSYLFVCRYEAGAEHPTWFVEKAGERRVLLEGPVQRVTPSLDGKYVAYQKGEKGSDWQTIYVIETASSKLADTPIEWVKFSRIAWDDHGFFYCRFNPPIAGEEYTGVNTGHKVCYHKLRSKEDTVVFSDPTSLLSVFTSPGYVVVSVQAGYRKNALFVKEMGSDRGFVSAAGPSALHEYVGIFGKELFVATDSGAPMGRVIAIDLHHPNIAREVVPEQRERLESAFLYNKELLCHYLSDVTSRLCTFTRRGDPGPEISLPGLGSLIECRGSRDSPDLYYTYTAYQKPQTVYHYSFPSEKTKTVYAPTVPIDLDAYETLRLFYPSKDGTKIPLFLVRKRGVQSGPTLLYAYGGFDIPVTPRFRPQDYLLLEQGGILAVANIRGGGEYGAAWHNAGRLTNKQTVFDDYIAAAEYLFAKGYTKPSQLALSGRSNGGLLVGAVTAQRPDLAAVALPGVGVMDMLRFPKFTQGYAWISEYGSPDNPLHYKALRAYSPYHNLHKGVRYPATLVTTADHDDRVVPAHSYKYISALQATGEGPYYIRIDTDAGHGAGAPLSQRLALYRDEYAFLFFQMNASYQVLP